MRKHKPKRELPSCSGYYDYWGEFDCNSAHGEGCDHCLCNYNWGGFIDPDSGHRLGYWTSRIWFGTRVPRIDPGMRSVPKKYIQGSSRLRNKTPDWLKKIIQQTQ